MAGMGPAPCRAVVAEDIRDLQRWARHDEPASGGRFGWCQRQGDAIERAHDVADRPGGDPGVERGGVELGVPQQDLDHADVDVLLQQMGGEAVAQGVRRHALADIGQVGRRMAGPCELARCHRLNRIAARKQPALWLCHLPPGAQQVEQMRRQHHVAILAALVRFAQSYILGRLRHQTFFSLGEVNAAIAVVLGRINGHVMRRLGVSRRDLFTSVERPALKPLPEMDYEFAEWRLARVGLDYHVEVQSFLYSVPHSLIREQVDVRIAARTIEVFHRGRRVAAHQRRYGGRRHGTNPDHMPSAHRRYAEWTPERFRRWARSIGPSTEGLVVAVLANRPHPEQGFRTCLGVLRLFKGLDPARAETVSARAVEIGALNYKSIASILANKLDRSSRQTENAAVIDHPNVRGPRYFH